MINVPMKDKHPCFVDLSFNMLFCVRKIWIYNKKLYVYVDQTGHVIIEARFGLIQTLALNLMGTS